MASVAQARPLSVVVGFGHDVRAHSRQRHVQRRSKHPIQLAGQHSCRRCDGQPEAVSRDWQCSHSPNQPGGHHWAEHKKNCKQPPSYQWSLGVQRSLGARTVVSLSYGGNTNRYQNDYTQFNISNHTRFNQASNNFGSNNFGQFTSAFDPRILQLGVKLYF